MISIIDNKDKSMKQVFIYIVLIVIFLFENNHIIGKYNIYSSLDSLIPFVPVFVIPYFMWYAFILFTGIYLFFNSREDLGKTFLAMNICMSVAMIIYAVFPNYQSLRPEIYGEDMFSMLVKLLYEGDSTSSVCPSLHVAISIVLYEGLKNSSCFNNKPSVKILLFMLTVLICISTVFLKQHSVIDVAAGMLLSFVSCEYVYRIMDDEKFSLSCEQADNSIQQ